MSNDLDLFVSDLTIALGDNINCSLAEAKTIIQSVVSGYAVTKIDSLLPSTGDGSTTLYLCRKFVEAKAAKGMKEKSCQQYIYAIKALCNYCNKEVTLITSDDIIKYLDYYRFNGNSGKNQPVSDRAVQNKYLYFSSFFSFLFKHHYIANNPLDLVDLPKANSKQDKPLSTKEKEQVLLACSELPDCNGSRERAMALIIFALETGARNAEICNMNISDIDITNHTATIVGGKGNKDRISIFGDKTALYLEKYLKSRKDDITTKNRPLFVSLNAPYERLHTDAIRIIFERIAELSGVTRLHPHLLRATCATDLIKKGVPITVVAQQLGHESIETTSLYTRVDSETSKQLIAKTY